MFDVPEDFTLSFIDVKFNRAIFSHLATYEIHVLHSFSFHGIQLIFSINGNEEHWINTCKAIFGLLRLFFTLDLLAKCIDLRNKNQISIVRYYHIWYKAADLFNLRVI